MPRSFADLQKHILQVSKVKGTEEAKKAGSAYCADWNRELETSKRNLESRKALMPIDQYNAEVLTFNKQLAEMNMSVNAFKSMLAKK